MGKLSVETKDPDQGCPWYINSPEDNYCFWTWVRRMSDSNGFMEPISQSQMTELLGISSSKLHSYFKEALLKLKDIPEYEALEEIFDLEDS